MKTGEIKKELKQLVDDGSWWRKSNERQVVEQVETLINKYSVPPKEAIQIISDACYAIKDEYGG